MNATARKAIKTGWVLKVWHRPSGYTVTFSRYDGEGHVVETIGRGKTFKKAVRNAAKGFR